jgi:hypothetical protein
MQISGVTYHDNVLKFVRGTTILSFLDDFLVVKMVYERVNDHEL